MHVRFVLSRNTLLVTLFQVADGVVNSFNLCSLDLAELVVGWIWGEKDMFVIAAKQDERLYYDICCFPVDLSRNAWLECFESRGVKTMVMFKTDRPLPLARTCSKYLMLCLSESSERHSSGGSGNALENAGARGVDEAKGAVTAFITARARVQASSSSEMTMTSARLRLGARAPAAAGSAKGAGGAEGGGGAKGAGSADGAGGGSGGRARAG